MTLKYVPRRNEPSGRPPSNTPSKGKSSRDPRVDVYDRSSVQRHFEYDHFVTFHIAEHLELCHFIKMRGFLNHRKFS